jgi:hypothetical protein
MKLFFQSLVLNNVIPDQILSKLNEEFSKIIESEIGFVAGVCPTSMLIPVDHDAGIPMENIEFVFPSKEGEIIEVSVTSTFNLDVDKFIPGEYFLDNLTEIVSVEVILG